MKKGRGGKAGPGPQMLTSQNQSLTGIILPSPALAPKAFDSFVTREAGGRFPLSSSGCPGGSIPMTLGQGVEDVPELPLAPYTHHSSILTGVPY